VTAHRKLLTLASAIVSVAIGATWLVAWRLDIDPEPGRLVHAGPRTTVLTEPLLPDGSVDYVAWMTGRLHEGVTAENDLAPVISLCMEDPIRGVTPAASLERPPAPVISWDSWCDDHPLEPPPKQPSVIDADTESEPVDPVETSWRSWASCNPNGPHAAEMRVWLASIGPALDLIVRESRTRGRWFERPDELSIVPGSFIRPVREVIPALCARAIGNAMDGGLARAIDDLECARRVGTMIPTTNGILAMLALKPLESRWQQTCEVIAEHFEGMKCVDFRRLDAIGRRFDLDEEVAAGRLIERIRVLGQLFVVIRDWRVALDAAESMNRTLASMKETLRSGSVSPATDQPTPIRAPPPPPKLRASETDRLLEAVNTRLDAIDAAVTSTKDWRTRIADVRRLGDQFRSSYERKVTLFWDFWRTDRPLDEWARRAPDRSADLIAELETPLCAKAAISAISHTADADRARVQCAIACFKNEFGRSPATLDELVPACFDAPPMDRICHKPMELTFGADGKLDVTSEALTLAAEIKADDKTYIHRK
jgi:hypothetical protein